MPLEVKELVVKVEVGRSEASPRPLDRQELARLKREVIAACLAEVRRQPPPAQER